MSISRSRFLSATGAAALAAAPGAAALGKGPEYQLREVVSRPFDLETQLKDLRPYITPTAALFVRSHFGPPPDLPAPGNYRLKIEGEVDRPLSLSLQDLRAMPRATVVALLQCAGNGRAFYRPRPAGAQWHWGAVGNARWTGVRVSDVLSRVGVRPLAAHVGIYPLDRAPSEQTPRFNRSLPLEKALDEDTILAYEVNGEPLPVEHGGPLRLIVPDWSGNNWVKWLSSLAPQVDETHGFWMDTAYRYPNELGAPGEAIPPEQTHHVLQAPVKSIITQPLEGEIVSADVLPIGGVAYSGYGDIAHVEISIDGGRTWQPAQLSEEHDPHGWRIWAASVLVTPATTQITARAVDRAGNAQPATQQWNPSGYFWNVYHSISIGVRG